MFNFLSTFLAQVNLDDPTYTTTAPPELNPLAMVGAIVAYLVIYAILSWGIYTKAGYPGWTSLIPIYNIYVLIKIAGKPGWWIILMFIPCVNIIFTILVMVGLAENFGKGGGFAAGLILLGFIFMPILSYGSAQYRGVRGGTLPGPTTPTI